MQAHISSSGVVMDIAAYKVNHSAGVDISGMHDIEVLGVDIDATTLQAKKRSA